MSLILILFTNVHVVGTINWMHWSKKCME
jgi:hypothetical protein